MTNFMLSVAKHLYERPRDSHLHLRQVQVSIAEERSLRVTN
jgi:hypothetical protein